MPHARHHISIKSLFSFSSTYETAGLIDFTIKGDISFYPSARWAISLNQFDAVPVFKLIIPVDLGLRAFSSLRRNAPDSLDQSPKDE